MESLKRHDESLCDVHCRYQRIMRANNSRRALLLWPRAFYESMQAVPRFQLYTDFYVLWYEILHRSNKPKSWPPRLIIHMKKDENFTFLQVDVHYRFYSKEKILTNSNHCWNFAFYRALNTLWNENRRESPLERRMIFTTHFSLASRCMFDGSPGGIQWSSKRGSSRGSLLGGSSSRSTKYCCVQQWNNWAMSFYFRLKRSRSTSAWFDGGPWQNFFFFFNWNGKFDGFFFHWFPYEESKIFEWNYIRLFISWVYQLD